MQEVEGVVKYGEYDYTKLEGQTGPLVVIIIITIMISTPDLLKLQPIDRDLCAVLE